MDIDIARRLGAGIIIFLMQGDREYPAVAAEDRGRSVAVMHVAIHHHRTANRAVLLQLPNRNRDIVDRAKALTVPPECVMKASTDVESDSPPQRIARGHSQLTQQIEVAYQLALCRAPTSTELKLMKAYAAKHGLANACRILLNSNEFLFID